MWPFEKEKAVLPGEMAEKAELPAGVIVGSGPGAPGPFRFSGLAPDHFIVSKCGNEFFISPLNGMLWLDGEAVSTRVQIPSRTVYLACHWSDGRDEKHRQCLLSMNGETGELWRPSRGAKALAVSHVSAAASESAPHLKPAIHDLSFDALPGEFVCITGRSGVGKSTLVELLLGCQHPASGTITIGGDLSPTSTNTSGQVSFCPQHLHLPPELKGQEIIDELAARRNVDLKQHECARENQLLRFSSLDTASHLLSIPIGSLSGGEYRRVSLCTALIRRQLGLLILDEPTTGLDPILERKVALALRDISRHGITVIAITHSSVAAELADRVLVLRPPPDNGGSSLSYFCNLRGTTLEYQLMRSVTSDETEICEVDSTYGKIINDHFG